MSLPKLRVIESRALAFREMFMDWIAQMPEWLDWLAAGIAGAIALAALASMLEAALDLGAD